jgi:hypothetical protein
MDAMLRPSGPFGAVTGSGLRPGSISTTWDGAVGSFDPVTRQCSRPGCAETAVATLTYVYARQFVWLDDLTLDRDPHAYDLCERHASRVRVPNGWRFDDRRMPAEFLTRLAG